MKLPRVTAHRVTALLILRPEGARMAAVAVVPADFPAAVVADVVQEAVAADSIIDKIPE